MDTNNLIQKFLPKQMDIDKIHVIQRKVLKKHPFASRNQRDSSRLFAKPLL